ncbi:hypothetical protein GCM10010240_22820 [Streptomyces griseoviridis]|nr:hypothetical protein GCM10010240_22820 [Streptomyces griseoviridis]
MSTQAETSTATPTTAPVLEQVPWGLTDIGAAADGTVWGVNAAGSIYRHTGDLPG